MKRNLLEYDFPKELKDMSLEDMKLLSVEIRNFLIENVSKTGGHIASNLGVVELTLALHKVFNMPEDKIVWDVGHQSYVHKLLTNRADKFGTLRQFGGMSGFPKRDESPYDVFDTGHSSTSISAAAGMAAARDLNNDDYSVVAVIGDGALTGGLAFEALNNVGDSNSKMIVVLNDNGMSISKNTGGVSNHLRKLRTSSTYLDFKKQLKKTLKGIPGVGEGIYSGIEHIRDSVKYAVVDGGALFETIGFKYLGPIDGHNLEDLIETLTLAQNIDGPVLIHAITKKGKGYKNAENNPNKFHGIGPFDPTTGSVLKKNTGESFSKVFGSALVNLAEENDKIVAICAAMIDGTGLKEFNDRFPERLFDVGIAEGHAVTFAAGMASNGYIPVVPIYSSFLQRGFDEIIEDVCNQNLPVIFGIDRAGVVGEDGSTHHGIFDISYMNLVPNMTILAPRDGIELKNMLTYACKLQKPCAIRYPRGNVPEINNSDTSSNLEFSGKSEVISTGKQVEIWAVGKMTEVAIEASEILTKRGYKVGVVNARVVKPIDTDTLMESCKRAKCIVTLEDNVITGGFGQCIGSYVNNNSIMKTKVLNLGWPDKFVEHGAVSKLFQAYGLDSKGVAERISEFIER